MVGLTYCARCGVWPKGTASAGPQPRLMVTRSQCTPAALSWSARFGGSHCTPPEPNTTGKSVQARESFSLETNDHWMPASWSSGMSRVLKAISLGKKPWLTAGDAPHASG